MGEVTAAMLANHPKLRHLAAGTAESPARRKTVRTRRRLRLALILVLNLAIFATIIGAMIAWRGAIG